MSGFSWDIQMENHMSHMQTDVVHDNNTHRFLSPTQHPLLGGQRVMITDGT
jgi:hypothetical protein